jgi:hypothetical protein
MPTPPQEGEGVDGRSTQALVPTGLTAEYKTWTDGQTTCFIHVETQYAKYRIELGFTRLIELYIAVGQVIIDILREKAKGR